MPTNNKLLVVEDDPGLQDQLRWCFDRYEVIVAGDRTAAMEQLRKHQPPVVTLDLGLPPDANGISEGLATLEAIVSQRPDTKVIVVTGQNDRENAVRAVGSGAYDFYHKPIDAEILGMIVNRAYRLRELELDQRHVAVEVNLELVPRVLRANGLDVGAGLSINPVPPEKAARVLRGGA